MVVTTEIGNGQLADLVKQVQAGNEVVLTDGDKPVARLVAAHGTATVSGSQVQIRSLRGHRVLTPVISHQDLADEMFNGQ